MFRVYSRLLGLFECIEDLCHRSTACKRKYSQERPQLSPSMYELVVDDQVSIAFLQSRLGQVTYSVDASTGKLSKVGSAALKEN